MTYNVFGGTLNLAQSIDKSGGGGSSSSSSSDGDGKDCAFYS